VRAYRIIAAVAGAVLALAAGAGWLTLRVPKPDRPFLPFAADKACAVSIIDDTDFFQLHTTLPVYRLIDSLGIRLTKTIWVFDGGRPERAGLSLADLRYRRWVIDEQRKGHEITLHSASSGDDVRARTLAAYDTMHVLFGEPRLEVFHSDNKEALYWGRKRVPGPVLRRLYDLRQAHRFEGDEPDSPYYWLDRSRDLVRYVRTYTFNDIDTWAVNPTMPYVDPSKPDAPLWFASSNGRMGGEFVRLFRRENVARLKRDRGVSVVYTHFGAAFAIPTRDADWRVRDDVEEALVRCASDPAVAFVPAGELLDRLLLIHVVERQLRGGTRSISLPSGLRGAFSHVSVDPVHTRHGYRDPAATERMSLEAWIARSRISVVWEEMSLFDVAPRIPPTELWRVAGKWLLTQLVSPT
jgi:hypothetical protein